MSSTREIPSSWKQKKNPVNYSSEASVHFIFSHFFRYRIHHRYRRQPFTTALQHESIPECNDTVLTEEVTEYKKNSLDSIYNEGKKLRSTEAGSRDKEKLDSKIYKSSLKFYRQI